MSEGYNKKHDAWFDPETFEWLDTNLCGDADCEFCKDRPPTAKGLENEYPFEHKPTK